MEITLSASAKELQFSARLRVSRTAGLNILWIFLIREAQTIPYTGIAKVSRSMELSAE